MKGKKIFSIIGILAGVLAIIFSFTMFDANCGYYESSKSYGGDAYTGIQNASAQAANNAMYAGESICTGIGFALMISGLYMICLFGGKLSECKAAAKPAAPTLGQPQTPAFGQPQMPACAQPQAPAFGQPQAPVHAQPQAPIAPQGNPDVKIGRCEMCNANDVTIRKVQINSAQGTRFRHVCDACIRKYNFPLA